MRRFWSGRSFDQALDDRVDGSQLFAMLFMCRKRRKDAQHFAEGREPEEKSVPASFAAFRDRRAMQKGFFVPGRSITVFGEGTGRSNRSTAACLF